MNSARPLQRGEVWLADLDPTFGHEELSTMTSLTMKPGGELTLPPRLCEQYGLTPETPIRILETRAGLLLIPVTDAPMDAALAYELAEWQALSVASWNLFPSGENEAAC